MGDAFPLILTFSHREKEQPLPAFGFIGAYKQLAAIGMPCSWEHFSLSQRACHYPHLFSGNMIFATMGLKTV